ncbi:hypothetical protein PUN28_008559 [Cardiocondyla obscurior]|uniref:Uncharacterized protein n=1 Tax=Cardiocondyla obscurior TaxID=286306 RepID=A0AAW2G3D4_9HYME
MANKAAARKRASEILNWSRLRSWLCFRCASSGSCLLRANQKTNSYLILIPRPWNADVCARIKKQKKLIKTRLSTVVSSVCSLIVARRVQSIDWTALCQPMAIYRWNKKITLGSVVFDTVSDKRAYVIKKKKKKKKKSRWFIRPFIDILPIGIYQNIFSAILKTAFNINFNLPNIVMLISNLIKDSGFSGMCIDCEINSQNIKFLFDPLERV